jgi:hypothetical protein
LAGRPRGISGTRFECRIVRLRSRYRLDREMGLMVKQANDQTTIRDDGYGRGFGYGSENAARQKVFIDIHRGFVSGVVMSSTRH